MTALLNLAEAQREFQKVSPQAKVSDFALLDGMAKDIIRAAKLISAVAPLIDGQNMRPSVADLAIRKHQEADDNHTLLLMDDGNPGIGGDDMGR